MFERSVSTPFVSHQDLDGSCNRATKYSVPLDTPFDTGANNGRIGCHDTKETKLQKKIGFSLSNLGKKMVSVLSFHKNDASPKCIASEDRRTLQTTLSGGYGLWSRRDSSVKRRECFESVNSKRVSVSPSFKDSSEAADAPYFDPDLLNVFEKSLEQLPAYSDGGLRGTAVVETSSTNTRFPNQNLNDGLLVKVNSMKRNKVPLGVPEEKLGSFREKKEMKLTKRIFDGLLRNSFSRKDVLNVKRIVSIVTSQSNEQDSKSELLSMFPLLCPPEGEDNVVLFFTSLRGIRKTYENCNSVRMVLFGLGVKVDERDVSMHSDFKQELRELLGKSISLPRIFIKGRYIGGAEEVMQLNEEGVLAKLLEDVPKTSLRACEGCGDMRFIPCNMCSGSCKVVSQENKVVRCPCCNENGLIRCTICCS